MPARNIRHRFRLVPVAVLLLAAAAGLAAQPQPDPGKKPAESPQTTPKSPYLPRLVDGTFQWLPAPGKATDTERVLISPLELQKLNDQIDQLKKQAASRKPVAPSGCAIRITIEKRGETIIAVVRTTYSFRTVVPNAVVALGGKRGFLVSASLDGRRGFLGPSMDAVLGKRIVPVLDTTEEGFAALIESTGPHTLVLDLEVPVTARGAKTEIGFEFGLPRAAITTLIFEPQNTIARVNVTTRTPDPAQPLKLPDVRRVPGLDVKQLAYRQDSDAGFPLGPVDSLEMTWEQPAAAAQPTDAVLSAEWDVLCKLTDRVVELEAKLQPRGQARTWRVLLPKGADLSVTRAVRDPGMDIGPVLLPTIGRPADPNKPIWTVEIPAGSTSADWLLTATMRYDRVKPPDPAKPPPIPIGPFAVLDVARQTGALRITAAGSVRFEFDHGSELHRIPVPDPSDTGNSELQFRLTAGPASGTNLNPWLHLKTFPVAGAMRVKSTYRLQLTPTAWQVEADLLITPVRAELDSLTLELPVGWRSLVAGPVELVEGVLQDEKSDGPRRVVVIRLASGQRRPFELKLRAITTLNPIDGEGGVFLPRFPTVVHRDGKIEVSEREASVTASVGAGLELRGSGRGWDGEQPAAWGTPLAATADADGKAGRSLTGRFEHGLARLDLAWQPHRPELTAEQRAEVTVERRQIVIAQTIRFRGPGGLPKVIRFRGPVAAIGLKSVPPLRQSTPGEWQTEDGAEAKDGVVRIEYALPIRKSNGEDRGPWSVAVPLFWPVDATKTETTTQIWTGTDRIQLDGIQSRAWRELASEPSPTRPMLPTATLAATSTDVPLGLDLREVDAPGGASVWVSRGLIRVRTHEMTPAQYEVRYLIDRWHCDVAEIHIPGPLIGENPEVLIDGLPVDPNIIPDPDDSSGAIVRVRLPDARLQPVEIEINYQQGNGRGASEMFQPPRIRSAAYDGLVRWHVILPSGSLPILFDRGMPEQRWQLQSGMLVPMAGPSVVALDEWFRTGIDPSDDGSTGDLVVRQATPASIRVASVPRIGMLLVCSLGVAVLGFAVTRLRSSIAGPLIALLGGMVAAAAVRYPQPTAQIAGAAQPGVAVLALLLGTLAVVRWHRRRRQLHLPGFARVRLDHVPAPSQSNGTGSVRRPAVALGSTGSNSSNPEPRPMAPSGSKPSH